MHAGLTLDGFVQGLIAEWQCACGAKAAPAADVSPAQGLAAALADVVGRRSIEPAQVDVAFDCRLRQHKGRWHVDVVGPGRHPTWLGRVHRVRIVLHAADPPWGEVRFNGKRWYGIGARPAKRLAS